MFEANAFITGSQAYGRPNSSSDIDVVVLMSQSDMLVLSGVNGYEHNEEYPPTTASLRFGSLNLICTTDPKDFKEWQEGTRQLCSRLPVPREEAVDFFKSLFAASKSERMEEKQTQEEDFYGVQDLDSIDYESLKKTID